MSSLQGLGPVPITANWPGRILQVEVRNTHCMVFTYTLVSILLGTRLRTRLRATLRVLLKLSTCFCKNSNIIILDFRFYL